jgi:hypothetical protein
MIGGMMISLGMSLLIALSFYIGRKQTERKNEKYLGSSKAAIYTPPISRPQANRPSERDLVSPIPRPVDTFIPQRKTDIPVSPSPKVSLQIHVKPPVQVPPPIYKSVVEQKTTAGSASLSTKDIIELAIQNGKDVVINYQNYNGVSSARRLSQLSINNEFIGYQNAHIKAYCHKRNEERSFKIARIISAQLVN